ncbi:hypothetical protein [Azospirillum sp. sgz302134]
MTTPIPFVDLTPIVMQAGPGQPYDGYKKATDWLIRWHGGTDWDTVFVERDTVTLAQVGKCSVRVSLALTRNGLWLSGSDYNAHLVSCLDGVSVWARRGYRSREDAIRAEAARCAEVFATEAKSQSSLATSGTRRDCARMAELLTAIAYPEQTALFDAFAPADTATALPAQAAPTTVAPAVAAKAMTAAPTPVQLSMF